MVSRRESLKMLGAAAAAAVMPLGSCSGNSNRKETVFTYCLNTSTIRGQGLGLAGSVEIAAEAGYDGVELWVRDIREYVSHGNSLTELRSILESGSLTVEGAIGFAPWIIDDPDERHNGFIQMEEEMNMMGELGCKRIAAPPAGFTGPGLDLMKAGERYRQLLDLGRRTGVMPHLEFWGGSQSLFHLGQALHIAAAADDPDVRILTDVYHLFRGGSGFNGLKMLDSRILEIMHMNDYPGDIPREEQNDSHRVYPGDGAAPVREIITSLYRMGGNKVLSLELFNPEYWRHDALEVASTGLHKMKEIVDSVILLKS